MKFKKFIIYLMAVALTASISAPVFADGEAEGGEGGEGAVTEDTGLIEGEDGGEDLFDSIVDANEGDKDSEKDKKDEQNTPQEPEQQEIELTAKQALSVKLMKNLGVFDKNVDLTANLSRAELARAIYVLTDCNLSSTSALNTFADINSDTKYLNEISAAYDLGYITGYMGEFRPDDSVKGVELAAVMNRALGVELLADYKGGWAAGHMSAADSYKLLDGTGINSQTIVTTLEAATAFTNLLNANVRENDYNAHGIEGYYMAAVLDMYKVSGMVTDNGITALDGSESIIGKIKINGEMYDAGTVDCEPYLGKTVDMYYRDVDGIRTVVALEARANQESLHINAEDIDGFSNRAYTYFEGRKKKTAKLEKDYNIIYNGRLVTDGNKFTSDMLVPDEGYIELLDIDGKSGYDIVIIENYITFVVNEYNASTNIITSKNNVPAIDFEKADICAKTMLGANGSEVEVEYRNLGHNGYVLSVARSLDERIVKVYMAEETVTGIVGSISDKEVIVDGKEYIASRELSKTVVSGGSYKLHLNQYGHIIWGERATLTDDQMAYFHKMYKDDSGDTLILELYTEDNAWLKTGLSLKPLIDGSTYTSVEAEQEALEKAIGSVVMFRVSSKNEIVKVDTTAKGNNESSDYSLNLVYENLTSAGFDSSTLAFGELYQSKFPTDFNTKVFCVRDPYKEGELYCYSLSAFRTKYAGSTETNIGKLWLYNTDEDSIIGTYALVKRSNMGTSANAEGSGLRTGALVTSVKNSVDEHGELTYVLTITNGTTTQDITIDEAAINFSDAGGVYVEGGNNLFKVSKGDLIKYGLNDDGIVEAGNLLVMYDCDEEWFNSSSNWASRYRYSNRWHYLWIYAKEGDSMITVNQSVSPVEKFDSGATEFSKLHTYVEYTKPLNGSPISIYVYDKSCNSLYESDLGEFTTYKEAGLDCTKVLGRYNSGHRFYIIYK